MINPDLIVARVALASQKKRVIDTFAESIAERATVPSFLEPVRLEKQEFFGEGVLRRPRKDFEKYINFAQIDYDMTMAHRAMVDSLKTAGRPIFRAIAEQSAKAIMDRKVLDISSVQYPSTQEMEDIYNAYASWARYRGSLSVIEEHDAAIRGEPATDEVYEAFLEDWITEFLREAGLYYAEMAAADIQYFISNVLVTAVQNSISTLRFLASGEGAAWLLTSIKNWAFDGITNRIEEEIDTVIDRVMWNNTGVMMNNVFAVGRAEEITKEKDHIKGGWYSAILDRRACSACLAHEGEWFEVGTVGFARYFNGNDAECLGSRINGVPVCRCLLALVFTDTDYATPHFQRPTADHTKIVNAKLMAPNMNLMREILMGRISAKNIDKITEYGTAILDHEILQYYQGLLKGNEPGMEYLTQLIEQIVHGGGSPDLLPVYRAMPDGEWARFRFPYYVQGSSGVESILGDEERMKRIIQYAKDADMDLTPFLIRMDNWVRLLNRQGEIIMPSNVDTLESVLSGARIDGIRAGAVNKDFKEWEKLVFGIPEDFEKVARPTYGWLLPPNTTSRMAGDVSIVLKNNVWARATVVYGEEFSGVWPSNANIPNWLVSALPEVGDPMSANTLNELIELYKQISVQVHGGLKAEDIAMIIFRNPPKAALVAKLDEMGIKWKMMGDSQAVIRPDSSKPDDVVKWVTEALFGLEDDYPKGTWPLNRVYNKRKLEVIDKYNDPMPWWMLGATGVDEKVVLPLPRYVLDSIYKIYNTPAYATAGDVGRLGEYVKAILVRKYGLKSTGVRDAYQENFLAYLAGQFIEQAQVNLGFAMPTMTEGYAIGIRSEMFDVLGSWFDVTIRRGSGYNIAWMKGKFSEDLAEIILGAVKIRRDQTAYKYEYFDQALASMTKLLESPQKHPGMFDLAFQRTLFDIINKPPKRWRDPLSKVTQAQVAEMLKAEVDLRVPQIQVLQALETTERLKYLIDPETPTGMWWKPGLDDFQAWPRIYGQLLKNEGTLHVEHWNYYWMRDFNELIKAKGWEDIGTITNYLGAHALHPELAILEEGTGIIYDEAGQLQVTVRGLYELLNAAWTTNTNTRLAQAFQHRLIEYFKLKSDMQFGSDVLELSEALDRPFRALIEAIYKSTQAELENAGIGEWVYLWKGADGKAKLGGDEFGMLRALKLPVLSSFTTDAQEALNYANMMHIKDGTPSIVLAKIPRSSIFAFPKTGLGSTASMEVVVLNNVNIRGLVWENTESIRKLQLGNIIGELDLVWDAWAGLGDGPLALITSGAYKGRVAEILGEYHGDIRVRILYTEEHVRVRPSSIKNLDEFGTLRDLVYDDYRKFTEDQAVFDNMFLAAERPYEAPRPYHAGTPAIAKAINDDEDIRALLIRMARDYEEPVTGEESTAILVDMFLDESPMSQVQVFNRWAVKRFGVPLVELGDREVLATEKFYNNNQEAIDKLGDIIYQVTQQQLKNLRVGDYVYLYRGMAGVDPKHVNPNLMNAFHHTTVNINTLSHFSSNLEKAMAYSMGAEKEVINLGEFSALMVVRIPVERVISNGAWGIGFPGYDEWIILGGEELDALVVYFNHRLPPKNLNEYSYLSKTIRQSWYMWGNLGQVD